MAPLENVPQGIEIAERLRHLLPFDEEKLGVQPEARERLSGERLRLRDLVFMVREDQVDAARMNIERLAQILDRHDRALDVPAGAAGSELGIPERLAIF